MKLAILIMAAGSSSRMGSIKQLLKIDGKTLLEKGIQTSKKITNGPILCVLGAHAETIKKEVTFNNIHLVINKEYASGLSSSIQSGIEYLQKKQLSFDGILILLADQPAIQPSYYQEMKTLFSANPQNIIASAYETKMGVPAIFPKKYLSEIMQIRGDKGAQEFIQLNKLEVLSPKIPVNLFDLDTPEDYDSYLKTC